MTVETHSTSPSSGRGRNDGIAVHDAARSKSHAESKACISGARTAAAGVAAYPVASGFLEPLVINCKPIIDVVPLG